MARWLALETANRISIWANCACPFPNTFVQNIFSLVLPDTPVSSSYDKEIIVWHLMDILSEHIEDPKLEKVRQYLKTDDGLKLYQFAHEVADLFDQYSLYRPEMVLDWETKDTTVQPGHIWQPHLWLYVIKRLQKSCNENHRAHLLQIFKNKISNGSFDIGILPSRIFLFGVSSLPPYHLSVLTSLADHIDLHLFIMNPCLEFWFDIVAGRDIVKFSRKKEAIRNDLHLEHGNSLLSSMGYLGRDFLSMIQELDCQETELFVEPEPENLLSCIQKDILLLKEVPDRFHTTAGRQRVKISDTSISFHSCHSPMREVEVLHDHLLELFDKNNDENVKTEPRDVLVMAPDINEYAPLIHAVFNQKKQADTILPYSISDQPLQRKSNYINTFFQILSVVRARFSSIDILDLLKTGPVKNRFSLQDNDIFVIEKWIHDTRICWAIDGNHRATFDLPDYNENTWRTGLDRLLLGYAAPGKNRSLFKNILPYDEIEGNGSKLLGCFNDFIETLCSIQETFRNKYTLSEWSGILIEVKEKLLLAEGEDTISDENLLHNALHDLHLKQLQTSFTGRLPINVIESYLSDVLQSRYASLAGAAGFLTGGITFCSMLPMRAIPFKVICLLGMNDGKFPRSRQKRSFDLISLEPRRGDRSRRHDDRYLFLETILSARNKLYISFEGQSADDGGRKPPSVLVSELMDYISQGYEIEGTDDNHAGIINQLSTNHKLQPFHPDYYDTADISKGKLFSYSEENYDAAVALSSDTLKVYSMKKAPSFSSPPVTDKEIGHHDLIRFFVHPSRYFLTRKVGISNLDDARQLNTSEPFRVSGLDRYNLEHDILDCLLKNQDPEELYSLKKAEGILPHGKMGEIEFTRTLSDIQHFKKKIDAFLQGNETHDMEIHLTVKDLKISGHLKNIAAKGLVLYRHTTVKPKDMIRCWLNHLLFNCISLDDKFQSDRKTFIIGKDRTLQFNPVPKSNIILEKMIDIYLLGQTGVFRFFPETSHVYARAIHRGLSEQEALQKAKAKWEGNDFSQNAEKEDPYNSLLIKDSDPLDTLFSSQSKEIFLPIMEHLSTYKP
jgi:exodeoxyribonuclease V gamma subunit